MRATPASGAGSPGSCERPASRAGTADAATAPPPPGRQAAARPDLIRRDFRTEPTAVDTRWCGDITYIDTGQDWLYLATVIDIASRRVAGWARATHGTCPPNRNKPKIGLPRKALSSPERRRGGCHRLAPHPRHPVNAH
ncbi:DDE-type integrase/transposase/recombinase [Streptomyces sp. NBC_01565]|uniref:DDE-type integrase/transposase/recombinase n=1 Tax=unclassified Streptomyces TaxID=2593676 RepID=UPI00338E547B